MEKSTSKAFQRVPLTWQATLYVALWHCQQPTSQKAFHVSNVKAVSLIITLACLAPGHSTLTSLSALISSIGPATTDQSCRQSSQGTRHPRQHA